MAGQLNVPIGELDKVLKAYNLGRVELSTVLQQSIALMAGSDDMQRKLLRASETGVLNVCTARVQDIIHVEATSTNFVWFGDYILCTEAFVFGHPDNAGLIWARPDKPATVNNAIPIGSALGFGFAVDNLKNLHLRIVESGDIAIIAYTR